MWIAQEMDAAARRGCAFDSPTGKYMLCEIGGVATGEFLKLFGKHLGLAWNTGMPGGTWQTEFQSSANAKRIEMRVIATPDLNPNPVAQEMRCDIQRTIWFRGIGGFGPFNTGTTLAMPLQRCGEGYTRLQPEIWSVGGPFGIWIGWMDFRWATWPEVRALSP